MKADVPAAPQRAVTASRFAVSLDAATIVRQIKTILPLVALVTLVAVGAWFGPPFLQRRATLVFVDLSAVIGLYIFSGNSGILSFAHVSFMAVGAYASAILSLNPAIKEIFLPGLPDAIAHLQLPPFVSGLVGATCAAIFALVVGLVLMRLSGMSASIATFALLVIVYVVLGNSDSITGGQKSLPGMAAVVGIWTSSGVAVISLLIAFFYQETRSGLALRAAREDAVAARATGVHVYRERLTAFVLSAFVSGLSGVLLAHLLGILRVDTFYLDLTFITIAMLVIGGARSLAGAVAGTLVVAALQEMMRVLESGVSFPHLGTVTAPAGLGDVLVAVFMLLMVIKRPDGLTKGNEIA